MATMSPDRTHIPTQYEIETFSGRYVDTKNPNPESIVVEDIAHALANICRYGGHCREYYSVAEHSVFVSKRLERQGYPRYKQLAGLMHDASEAFLGDIPRPMKPLLGKSYGKLTDRMDAAIIDGLGLHEYDVRTPVLHWKEIKQADNWALFVEARHLLLSEGRTWTYQITESRIVTPDYWLGGLGPGQAKQLFLDRYEELTCERD